MLKENCLLVGTVFKLHGYKGEVNIYNDNDVAINFSELKYFLIDFDNTLVPFFISSISQKKTNIILVKFENIDSEDSAKKIYKRDVYLTSEFIFKDDTDEINDKKLIGYKVTDINSSDLGKVSYINSQSGQKVIYVEKNNSEFCFPMHKEFIKKIDTKKREIEVSIPKELLDLN